MHNNFQIPQWKYGVLWKGDRVFQGWTPTCPSALLFDSCNVCILIQRNTNNPPSATSGLEISRPSSFLSLSLNPSSHLYPLPLISECFLSPRRVVVKASCYEMVQSFKTLIHHQLSYATRRFQSAVFSCGDFSGVTVMELEKQGDTSRSQLHVINEVIK